MRNDVKRKLEMGARVREFARAHPSEDPTYATALARLEDRLARADALGLQQRAGRAAELAAVQRRDQLRRTGESQLLAHLVQAADLAEKEAPDLVGKFRLRRPNATHKAFVISARSMLAEATAHKELLVRHGLSELMLGELAKGLDQIEQETAASGEGRREHIGARVDLEAVAEEVVKVASLFNSFYRFKYNKEPELKAAWDSARKVLGPVRVRRSRAKQDGTTPPEAGSAPAA